jgi:hypothetical protein
MTTIEIELETGIHTNILDYAMGYILRKCFLTVHKEIKSMQNKGGSPPNSDSKELLENYKAT